ILAYKAEAEAEIASLSGAGENQDKLRTEISHLEKDLAARASALSAKRIKGAKLLGNGITEILSRLGMPKALFAVRVSAKVKESDPASAGKAAGNAADAVQEKSINLVCGPWGADDVEFMISANTGEPPRELARIASGGELSRVMLAIKTILYGSESGSYMDGEIYAGNGGHADADTLVFDEIDTGIGGEVALSVGEYLARISTGRQIFCVTHLASIAVRADNHLKVDKRVVSDSGGKERTVTVVTALDLNGRRQEIARMLAGDSGAAALAHADELLAKYGIK
ncbi:MAG: DNA repair protein RecN, partial [Treponema sp.]|nr:DNA repair protein RecN [Treponema sp.]